MHRSGYCLRIYGVPLLAVVELVNTLVVGGPLLPYPTVGFGKFEILTTHGRQEPEP